MKKYYAIIISLGMTFSITLLSAESFIGPFVRSLPGWGNWTSYSSYGYKDDNGSCYFKVDEATTYFPIYGQMQDRVHASNVTLGSYQELFQPSSDPYQYGATYVSYSGDWKGSDIRTRISSANWEPFETSVTWRFIP